MPGFKLYEVKGYPEPLRLSEEHAKALGGKEVTETAAASSTSKSTSTSSKSSSK